ncbi:hypothetical protein [Enterobacter genomosp. O]|uniref:hypothetical protein n=1 Tax=Enterobacter genomosp. O TaxID=2364150 RepID=UPI0010427DC0|nr:hypothetical protein [Enterobacter genomosp. O]
MSSAWRYPDNWFCETLSVKRFLLLTEEAHFLIDPRMRDHPVEIVKLLVLTNHGELMPVANKAEFHPGRDVSNS